MRSRVCEIMPQRAHKTCTQRIFFLNLSLNLEIHHPPLPPLPHLFRTQTYPRCAHTFENSVVMQPPSLQPIVAETHHHRHASPATIYQLKIYVWKLFFYTVAFVPVVRNQLPCRSVKRTGAIVHDSACANIRAYNPEQVVSNEITFALFFILRCVIMINIEKKKNSLLAMQNTITLVLCTQSRMDLRCTLHFIIEWILTPNWLF